MSQSGSTTIETSQTTFDCAHLPNGWQWVALGELCDFQGGTQPPKSTFKSKAQAGYVRLLQIQDFKTDAYAVYVPDIAKLNKCDETDVLIGRYGASVGRILRGKAGAYNVAIVKTIPNLRAISKDYLFYVLNSADFQSLIRDVSARAAQAGFNKHDVSSLKIPLPPFPEQKRITAILNEQMAAVERARAAAEVQLEAAKDLPAAYLREVFESPEAQQWERRPLRDYVLSYKNGFGRRPKELEEGAIVLRLADVSGGFIDISNPRRGAMSPEEFSTYELQPSDVLFVRVNGSSHLIGRCIPVNLNRNDLAYNDHLIRVRLRDGLDSNYLKVVCDLAEVRTEIMEKASTSAGQLTINQDVIASIKVPLAPISEQQRIVSMLEEQTQTVNKIISTIQDQLDTINKLPAALLRHAFTGKL